MEIRSLNMQGLPILPYIREDGEIVVILQKDMAYYTSRGLIIVPKGFESDGCSMPRLFWRIIGKPFDFLYLREAILHDWLYKKQLFDRETSDLLFREEMQTSAAFTREGIRLSIINDNPDISEKEFNKEYEKILDEVRVLSSAKIKAIYWGLRVGGWAAWNNHARVNKKELANGEQ